MRKAMIVGGGPAYERLFVSMGFAIVQSLKDANVLCFTGGEDVSPELYGDAPHQYTGNNPARDEREADIFFAAKELDIPMVGICRGAQFLNVMSGGRMYQHVSGHTQDHFLIDSETGDSIFVSSTHHQMMMPDEKNAIILAYSTLGGFREWYDGQVFKRDISNTDYEVVFYPDTKCLCFQPHPEFFGSSYEGMQELFRKYLKEHLEL